METEIYNILFCWLFELIKDKEGNVKGYFDKLSKNHVLQIKIYSFMWHTNGETDIHLILSDFKLFDLEANEISCAIDLEKLTDELKQSLNNNL
jgi:hypothetical protein